MKLSLRYDDTEVKRRLEQLRRRGRNAWLAAGFLVGSATISKVRARIPFRSGELWGSRYVRRSDPVDMGFGAEHAAATHTLHRSRSHYLQKTLSAEAPRMTAALARAYARALAAGWTLETAPATHPTAPSNSKRRKTSTRRRTLPRRRR